MGLAGITDADYEHSNISDRSSCASFLYEFLDGLSILNSFLKSVDPIVFHGASAAPLAIGAAAIGEAIAAIATGVGIGAGVAAAHHLNIGGAADIATNIGINIAVGINTLGACDNRVVRNVNGPTGIRTENVFVGQLSFQLALDLNLQNSITNLQLQNSELLQSVRPSALNNEIEYPSRLPQLHPFEGVRFHDFSEAEFVHVGIAEASINNAGHISAANAIGNAATGVGTLDCGGNVDEAVEGLREAMWAGRAHWGPGRYPVGSYSQPYIGIPGSNAETTQTDDDADNEASAGARINARAETFATDKAEFGLEMEDLTDMSAGVAVIGNTAAGTGTVNCGGSLDETIEGLREAMWAGRAHWGPGRYPVGSYSQPYIGSAPGFRFAKAYASSGETKARSQAYAEAATSPNGDDNRDEECEEAIEEFIKSSGELKELSRGELQGFAVCNALEMLNILAAKCGAQVMSDKKEKRYFKVKNLNAYFSPSSEEIPTLYININGKLFKIRCAS